MKSLSILISIIVLLFVVIGFIENSPYLFIITIAVVAFIGYAFTRKTKTLHNFRSGLERIKA